MGAQLGRSSSGLFFRNLGRQPSGSQSKFYLGRDERKALETNARLERLWEAVAHRWERDEQGVRKSEFKDGRLVVHEESQRPVWDDNTLTIARAIVADAPLARVSPVGRSALERMAWLRQLRSDVPFVRIETADEETGRAIEEAAEGRAKELREEAADLRRSMGGQSLHPALRAYAGYVREKFAFNGLLTAWGKTQLNQVDFLFKHLPDVRLESFDMLAVEGCLDVIRKRPVSVTKSSKGARPISPSYAAAVVKQFRVFLRWLHRSSDWEWAKPRDYEVLPVRVVRTEHDRRRVGPHQVQTYGIDELIAVWGYATPRVRAYVALALNCAFGGAELASLRCDEVLLDAPHPYSRTLNLSNPVGSWIFRDRRKTGVYGEWRLWPMTVRAVRWALARRGDSPLPQLLLTRTGKPLDTATVANNKNAKIQNLWASTLRRVRADDPKFPVLSFNKLRKTAANMVRVEAGAEAASLMLAHGRGGEDDLLDVYTDRPFASLHSALSLLDARLQRVWDAAADPFPEGDEKMGGANISRGKIRQLQSLHRAGLKVAEICKRAEVSRETVRRWCGGGG